MDCPVDAEAPGHDSNHDHHDHADHSHDHGEALKDDPLAKRKLLLAGCLTGGFMFAEVAGGLVSGSLALIADAGHMLTDTAALWLAWYALWAAERPATRRNTFGLHRAKIVVAYTNGLALAAIILWIAFEAVGRLLSPQPILSDTMLLVAILGFLVNVGCLWLLHGGGNSLNMRGARLHVLGDLLGSIAAIAAALIIRFTGWTAADPLLSLLMCLVLGVGAVRLIRQSLHILLQGAPGDISFDDVKAGILKHLPQVVDVHHVHIWALDDNRPILTLHASLEPGTAVDDTVAAIKHYLLSSHQIRHSTVEIEFETCADTRVAQSH